MQNEAMELGTKNGVNPIALQVFKPGSWLSKIDYINHLVLFNNILILVLAERASGKTTFSNLLHSGLDTSIQSHVVKAAAPFSQAEFLAELNAKFGFGVDPDVNLSHFVARINEQKTKILIIIDDAQDLPESFLQEILVEIKNQGNHGFFHLCLVSDFSLSTILNKIDNELIDSLELGNLTAVETKTYLRTILPPSKKLDQILTDKELKQFYEDTRGNIACINTQVNDYYSLQANQSKEQRKYLLRGVSFLVTAAVALVASSFIWQNQFLPSSEDLEDNYDYAEFVEVTQPLPSLVPEIPLEELILISRLVDINHELATRGSQIPTWFEAANRQQVQPSPKRVVDIAIDGENDDSLVVRDRVVVIPKTITIHPESQVKPKALIKTLAIKEPTAQLKVKLKPFTIQLMASLKQQDLRRFVNKHNIKGIKIRLTQRDNVDWYVLTIGDYQQKKQALEAIKNLPTDLVRFHPWVRPTDNLKGIG
ncbi:MAG: SPOR domain-containing protein [Tatlockia sp.]|nr:SPOR domain-containing protein [Tatlockia sp.]